MSAKKKRVKPSPEASRKGEQSESNPNGSRVVWVVTPLVFAIILAVITTVATLDGHWDRMWVKVIAVPLLIIGTAFAFGELMFRYFRRTAKVSTSWAIAVALAMTSLAVWGYLHLASVPASNRVEQYVQPTPGVIEHGNFDVSLASGTTGPFMASPAWFWLKHNNRFYPSPFAGYLRFTNQRDKSFMIHSYSVETKIDGTWEPVPFLPISRHYSVYLVTSGTNFHNAGKLEMYQNVFDQLIESKNFAPHETVYAWVFWGAPTKGLTSDLRIKISDGTDVFVEPIKFLDYGGSPSAQGPGFRVVAKEDISGLIPQ